MTERLKPYIEAGSSLLLFFVLYRFLTSAFTYEVSTQIKERDDWTCVKCEKRSVKRVEASHINHDKRRGMRHYNSVDNGETRCPLCHYEYHYENHYNERFLGLTQKMNIEALQSIWDRLTSEEKVEIAKQGIHYRNLLPKSKKKEVREIKKKRGAA